MNIFSLNGSIQQKNARKSILSSFNATVSFGNSNYLHSLLYGQEL